MQGTRVLQAGPVLAIPEGPGWAAVQAGDISGDGLGDIVWHNDATHQMIIWVMNGTEVVARGPPMPAPP
jgi:hypothetical protein